MSGGSYSTFSAGQAEDDDAADPSKYLECPEGSARNEPELVASGGAAEHFENGAAPSDVFADIPGKNLKSGHFSGEKTQLSEPKRVGTDMGTLSLGRVDFNRLPHVNAAAPSCGDLSEISDAEMMLRAGAGDEECFNYLAAKYRHPIISFMYRMVHNQAIAEELAQEVFLRVYRARQTYRADARFTTWLYRIASNMAINHARDTKYERASSSVYLDKADEETGALPEVTDPEPLVEENLLRDERMARIREQVQSLPERQRTAVIMHKYQDMDYKQIGAVLKLSESATKSLLFRAYQTLRERLKEFA